MKKVLDFLKRVCYNINVARRYDGIGRRAGLKIQW